jgi:hypothetical protein
MSRPPFDGEAARKGLAARLSAIDGISLPEAALTKRPSFDLSLLMQPGALDRFLDTFNWVLSEIKKVEGVSDSI